jgi:ATP-dependent Clp protease adaptor protein ClpS
MKNGLKKPWKTLTKLKLFGKILIFHYISNMEESRTHKLVIYNDDLNSYDYIMACLIRFCDHERLQAEQCAVVAHNTGRCTVKSGDYMEMFQIKANFDGLDIKSEIKDYAGNMY